MKKQVTSRNYQSHRNLEQTAFNTYGKKVVRRSPDQEQHYYSDLKSSERNKTFDKRKDKEHNMSKGFDSKHSSMFKYYDKTPISNLVTEKQIIIKNNALANTKLNK